MSGKEENNLFGTSKEAEEQHLNETLDLIHANVERYSRDVAKMREEIDTMLEHFHDDNPELINELENTNTMYELMERVLERNERAQKKPYFGRIIFQDEKLHTEESIYIGRGGISKDAATPVVIDWRAPVANAYYENGLGKCTYLSPDGTEIPIDLKLKRTFEIENGTLQNFFDTEVIANDDLLTKYLSKNKQTVLGEIVATIQKEQNEIIRRTPYHNCIVQGVAGSGKTTVAMHRISYILYNYPERFRPDDFYIVGSNRILLNYITGVLPDLDVYGVRQMTMEQLFVRLLYEDWDEKQYRIKGTQSTGSKEAVKGSLAWFHDLESYCRDLEWESIRRESIYLNPKQFVEGSRDGKTGVYDETDGKPANPKDLVLLMDGAAVERYISQNPTISIQNKINMLNERLKNKIKDEFLKRRIRYTEAEQRAILKAFHGFYGVRTWKKSIYVMYQDFLTKQIAKGHQVDIPDTEFDVYDLAALAYLYKRVKETDEISEAHHVVIDEAQDFGMMAYSVLKYCIKDCTYTIMGDVSQNIHFGYGLNDWEELKKLYLTEDRACFRILRKSYRNTVEISNFATDILYHGQFSVYPVEPIIRHGNPVEVTEIDGPDAMMKQAASICRQWQKKGLDTIAVVCRNAQSAKKAAKELDLYLDVMESDLETAEFGKGVMVLPVEYTKGLEFDAVLILNPTREEYPADDGHAKLLYVAATRALHELCVLHCKGTAPGETLTGLIADPVPKRTVKDMEAEPEPAQIYRRSAVETFVEEKSKAQYIASKPLPKPAAQLAKKEDQKLQDDTAQKSEFAYGDMPATEILRPAGHSRIDLSVRFVSKQPDGLYLQSAYGVLRLSHIASNIVRVTFARGSQIKEGVHSKIAVKKGVGAWKYKDSFKMLEIVTGDLYLKVDKTTGAIQYMTSKKKPLLAERSKECRILEQSAQGKERGRFYLELQKGENLAALGAGTKVNLKLKHAARYISHTGGVEKLPLIVSDKGYGILVASLEPVFCSDISAYGTQICMENTAQIDYYFIGGEQTSDILSAYDYLCGKNLEEKEDVYVQ